MSFAHTYRCPRSTAGAAGIAQVFPEIFQAVRTHTRLSAAPSQRGASSCSECRSACHKRGTTLTISEFTSGPGEVGGRGGSTWSGGPPSGSARQGQRERRAGGGEEGEGAWLPPFLCRRAARPSSRTRVSDPLMFDPAPPGCFRLALLQRPTRVVWVVITRRGNWFARITPRV